MNSIKNKPTTHQGELGIKENRKMCNVEMKQYAEEYLGLHNEGIQELWEKLEEEFFNNMLASQHGNINYIDDEWCEIEIRGTDSRSGNPILFRFPKSMAG